MIHALLSLIFCLPILIIGLPFAICFWPAMFYLGREHAQAEYRYIEAHGKKRANCPWYCGFLPSAWTLKGVLDWFLPLVVCVVAVVVACLLK